MDLDERKIIILKAIIKSYMETGEPVGSRTLSKMPGLSVSSATIRNEMSDLEEMGYIVQPHTSAGRVPSDKGYRFYVDEIQKSSNSEVTEFKELMLQRVDKLEYVLKQLAKIIATNTNYAAMISGPSMAKNKIKFIQLSQMERYRLLVAIVMEGNIINNRIIDIDNEITQKELNDIIFILNSNLNGLSPSEINIPLISKIKNESGNHKNVMESIIDAMEEEFKSEDENLQVYTSGATNIFKYPELSDSSKAKNLIEAFEEKDKLREILAEANDDDKSGLKVYIGEESPMTDMKDCSLVTANYEFGEGIKGTIGIVGPKRMDYEKVFSTLHNVLVSLDATFRHD